MFKLTKEIAWVCSFEVNTLHSKPNVDWMVLGYTYVNMKKRGGRKVKNKINCLMKIILDHYSSCWQHVSFKLPVFQNHCQSDIMCCIINVVVHRAATGCFSFVCYCCVCSVWISLGFLTKRSVGCGLCNVLGICVEKLHHPDRQRSVFIVFQEFELLRPSSVFHAVT
jgi:hypothetical protein